MGRPTFIIDPQRLRDLRTEAGKTLLDVAKDIQAKLGMKHPSNDATLLSCYQRIERTGNTSRRRADALADIFEVTIEVLQGKGTPKPSDYLARITSLLREQFSTGTNEVLIRALEQSAGTSELNDESISLLAEDIADRIEAAQLGRNPSELAVLTEITGLPESELLKPANVRGHWLFIANGPGIHRTELVRGTSGVAWCVRDIVEAPPDSYGSDGSIRMFRDEPWFRLEIRRSSHPTNVIRIDFVRCDPSNGKGISWSRATWRERFLLERSLKEWAYDTANFVSDFDGRQSPTGDVRRLRLLVTEYGESPIRPTGRIVISGNLSEIPDRTFERFQCENLTHNLVLSWLAGDLKRSLAPFLAEHPQMCWSIGHCGQVTITLDEHKARKRPLLECYFGVKYRIRLVEEVGDNEFSPVPWRIKDVKQLCDEIQNMLDDPNEQSFIADEPRRAFEPCVAEE
ncbi:MAG: helix-turn-helix transcriptional regulator [Gallionella sp.]|nr:helix-turn-helix transcriptional regulator [Gallionella sp.]